jgi:hypothetical protein
VQAHGGGVGAHPHQRRRRTPCPPLLAGSERGPARGRRPRRLGAGPCTGAPVRSPAALASSP